MLVRVTGTATAANGFLMLEDIEALTVFQETNGDDTDAPCRGLIVLIVSYKGSLGEDPWESSLIQ